MLAITLRPASADTLSSYLCDRLLARGHEVLCADDIFTGTRRNVEHLHDNPRFELMRHDGSHLVSMARYFSRATVRKFRAWSRAG